MGAIDRVFTVLAPSRSPNAAGADRPPPRAPARRTRPLLPPPADDKYVFLFYPGRFAAVSA